jgi:hypothetical protein
VEEKKMRGKKRIYRKELLDLLIVKEMGIES